MMKENIKLILKAKTLRQSGVTIGGTFGSGFLGMIFAVPVFGIIYEFMKEFLEKKREGLLN